MARRSRHSGSFLSALAGATGHLLEVMLHDSDSTVRDEARVALEQLESPALLERLQEVDGHLEALAADCRSLATTQQAAEEVRTAAEAAMQEQAQALAQVEQQLRVVTEQAAVQQALLRDRTSSLEEQRAAAFLLETELQEAAAVADACQQEAAALRLSLRLESRDKTKALEQLQASLEAGKQLAPGGGRRRQVEPSPAYG